MTWMVCCNCGQTRYVEFGESYMDFKHIVDDVLGTFTFCNYCWNWYDRNQYGEVRHIVDIQDARDEDEEPGFQGNC